MERYLQAEVATANMPRIRVQPKSTKKYRSNNHDDLLGGYPMSGSNKNSYHNRNYSNFMDASARHLVGDNYQRQKSDHKPRLNYDVLIARAQKKVNGTDKEKVTKPKEYEAARPDHQYESE